jgi:osmoprotectant transport system permease protein
MKMTLLTYFKNNIYTIFGLILEHLQLTGTAILTAIIIGVPLGIVITRYKRLAGPILAISSIFQTIPSIAFFGILIPFLGIGKKTAILVLFLYALLPIVKNTYTGINEVSDFMIDAGRGMGMTNIQILRMVELPQSLSVIMAGVRISAVTAVGLMTMAAFIGAGGLGYLVFSGIRTVNNMQILAGAIPACILALSVDFLFSLIEKLVTPVSLQSNKDKSIEQIKNTKKQQKYTLGATALVIAALFIYASIPQGNTNDRVIRVGGKDFTEQLVLANMVSELIEENTDISVERHINLGGTQVCFSALKADEIDLYIDYSGTAYTDLLKHSPNPNMDEVYNTAKSELKDLYNIDVLKQMNFNNTYTLAVPQDIAQQYNLESISDLAKQASALKLGATLEFLNREDAFIGLQKLYRINLKETIGLDGSARYLAVDNGEVQVVDAFATDGLLKKFDLHVLEDDKQFFPPYYAMPLIREEAAEEFPEVEPLLEELGQILTDEVVIDLNYQVDELQREPSAVAHDFLLEHGLIE